MNRCRPGSAFAVVGRCRPGHGFDQASATRRRSALALAALLVLAGCSRSAEQPPAPTASAPFADCAALTAPPREARPADSGSVAPGGAPAPPRPLPEVSLPCYTGGAPVRVAALRGPAVVNLWASWCEPCRKELPVLARYAERAADQVHVIGVVTEDTRSASTALAKDLGLRFPMLFDDTAQLRRQLNRTALPITLFVDAAGQIRLLYNSVALDESTLDLLGEQYLGIVVVR